MKDVTPAEIARLEDEARVAENELAREIAEAESDASEVSGALREMRLRLEEEQLRGANGLDAVLAAVRKAVPPVVPLDHHEARVLETRADALRARLWIVTAMRDDLKRFTFELGDCVKLSDEAREAIARLAEQPRINMRPRLERIRTITADLAARGGSEPVTNPRRLMPRIRLETVIDLHSQSNFFTGITENISDGGLFLATDDPFVEGTEVDLAFTLPVGIEVRARGTVRWLRDGSDGLSRGVGIAFTYLSASAQEAIQTFLLRREPIIREGA